MSKSLSDWLTWIKSLHVSEMDLSLERVKTVGNRLGVLTPSCPVITVAGTNGKGSCVAGLESIYLSEGYRVGAFTTPILFSHHEQVRVQRKEASDEDFCSAYEAIEKARAAITLTPFEFNALAAFIIFSKAKLDVWLLEVGLGGRWDAVNAIDTNLAVVTSIGIDHTEWLGTTREAIAYEKAGIFRKGVPVVCGDEDPPTTLVECAKKTHSPFYVQARDFHFQENESDWSWKNSHQTVTALPHSFLAIKNRATILMSVDVFQSILPVSEKAIRQGLAEVTLPGRIQVIEGLVTHLLDVSHNPHAAQLLVDWLKKNKMKGKTRAVFSMLKDKDIPGTIDVMKNQIHEWYSAPLKSDRAASLTQLEKGFKEAGQVIAHFFTGMEEAYQLALTHSQPGDRLVIFGSFRTVAEIFHLVKA